LTFKGKYHGFHLNMPLSVHVFSPINDYILHILSFTHARAHAQTHTHTTHISLVTIVQVNWLPLTSGFAFSTAPESVLSIQTETSHMIFNTNPQSLPQTSRLSITLSISITVQH